MIRSTRFFLETFLVLGLLCLIGVATIGVRLAQGPIDLAEAKPWLLDGLNGLHPELKFDVAQAQLAWPRTEHLPVRLELSGVTITNQAGQKVGALDNVGAMVAVWPLLRGQVSPTALWLKAPRIFLTRRLDGSVGFDLNNADTLPTSNTSFDIVGWWQQSAAKGQLPPALRYLKRINIAQAKWRYWDQRQGWDIGGEVPALNFVRRGFYLQGQGVAKLKMGEKTLTATINLAEQVQHRGTVATLNLSPINLSRLNVLHPAIKPLVDINIPFRSQMVAIIDQHWQPVSVEIAARTTKKGNINWKNLWPQSLALKKATLRANYNPLSGDVTLQDLTAQIAEFEANAKATLEGEKLILQAGLKNVSVDKLKYYWPPTLGTNAYDWVTQHLSAATVEQAGLNLTGQFNRQTWALSNYNIGGRMNFDNMRVDYLPPMPAVDKAKGYATFDNNNFEIVLNAGQTRQTNLQFGVISIMGVASHHSQIMFDLQLQGPVNDALFLVGHKPIELTQKVGLGDVQIGGNTNTYLTLTFPLIHDLRLEDVQVETMADITNLNWPNGVLGQTITAQKAKLHGSNKRLYVVGDMALNGALAKAKWRENFDDKKFDVRTSYDVQGALPKNLIDKYVSPELTLQGSPQITLKFTDDFKNNSALTATANLASTSFALPWLGYNKAQGVAANASVDATYKATKGWQINAAKANFGGGVTANVAGQVAANGQDVDLVCTACTWPNTSGKFNISKQANNYNVQFNGPKLNAVSLYDWYQKQPKTTDAPKTNFNVAINTSLLQLHPTQPLKNVALKATQRGGIFTQANLDAVIDQPQDLQLRLTSTAAGARTLRARTTNAGAALQALRLSESVRGGTLVINATPSANAPHTMSGMLTLNNFTLVKAPLLAKLVNAVSPTGLFQLLNNDGLHFDTLDAPFSNNTGKVTLTEGRLAGASLGLSFRGSVDLNTNIANVRGTIIPVQGMTKLVSKIPVLGELLTGTDAGGVVGASYRIKGDFATAEATVNPLSVLTPGILRSIFFEGDDELPTKTKR